MKLLRRWAKLRHVTQSVPSRGGGGDLDPHLIQCFLGLLKFLLQTASRPVYPFLRSSSMWPTSAYKVQRPRTASHLQQYWCRNIRTLRAHLNGTEVIQRRTVSGTNCPVTINWPQPAPIGGGRGQWLGGTMASAEHEPITGVLGQSPQRGPGAEPRVRGAKPPWSWKHFGHWMSNGAGKFSTLWFLVEFNSLGPAVGRLGSDSNRGAQVEAGGLSPP